MKRSLWWYKTKQKRWMMTIMFWARSTYQLADSISLYCSITDVSVSVCMLPDMCRYENSFSEILMRERCFGFELHNISFPHRQRSIHYNFSLLPYTKRQNFHDSHFPWLMYEGSLSNSKFGQIYWCLGSWEFVARVLHAASACTASRNHSQSINQITQSSSTHFGCL